MFVRLIIATLLTILVFQPSFASDIDLEASAPVPKKVKVDVETIVQPTENLQNHLLFIMREQGVAFYILKHLDDQSLVNFRSSSRLSYFRSNRYVNRYAFWYGRMRTFSQTPLPELCTDICFSLNGSNQQMEQILQLVEEKKGHLHAVTLLKNESSKAQTADTAPLLRSLANCQNLASLIFDESTYNLADVPPCTIRDRKFWNLRSLLLSMQNQELRELEMTLSALPLNLESLALVQGILSDTYAPFVLQAVSSRPHLRSLCLSDNSLNLDFTKNPQLTLDPFLQLHELDLSGNKLIISPRTCAEFSKLTGLKKLSLAKNKIEIKEWKLILEFLLPNLPQLQFLDLSDNKIHTNELREDKIQVQDLLLAILHRMESLRVLNLNFCGFKVEGLSSFGIYLRQFAKMPCLRQLHFKGNTDIDVIDLHLPENSFPMLELIDVSENEMSVIDQVTLLRSLGSQIQYINFTGNLPIGTPEEMLAFLKEIPNTTRCLAFTVQTEATYGITHYPPCLKMEVLPPIQLSQEQNQLNRRRSQRDAWNPY